MSTDLELDQAIKSVVADIVASSRHVDGDVVGAPRVDDGRRQRWMMAAAAAAVVVVGVGAIAVVSGRGEPSTTVTTQAPAPSTAVGTVPPPDDTDASGAAVTGPDRFPVVSDTWPYVSSATAMWGGMIGLDNPTWTDAVVAVDDGVTLRDAVRITMGSFVRPSWGTPEPATVSGVEVEVYTGTWADEVTTVVLPGDPQLSVSGRDPIGYLEAVGASPVGDVQVGDDGTISFAVRTIPDEYQVIVEPTPLQRGSVDAVTQAGDGEAADGMAAFVSLQNPLVTIAPISDLERVDINGIDAWLFDMDPGAQVLWPASGATWVSVSGAATVDTTLAFARSIELVDQATWSARYDVLSARYPSAEPPESGEPMTTDQPASATAPAGTTSPHSGALVIARTEVGSLPTESPIGCGEAPSTDESLGDAPVADSADAALAAFLGTNRAQTLFTNGYELLTTSGSSTHRYERRNDSGSVVTVIVVEPASGGWRASRVQASPC